MTLNSFNSHITAHSKYNEVIGQDLFTNLENKQIHFPGGQIHDIEMESFTRELGSKLSTATRAIILAQIADSAHHTLTGMRQQDLFKIRNQLLEWINNFIKRNYVNY